MLTLPCFVIQLKLHTLKLLTKLLNLLFVFYVVPSLLCVELVLQTCGLFCFQSELLGKLLDFKFSSAHGFCFFWSFFGLLFYHDSLKQGFLDGCRPGGQRVIALLGQPRGEDLDRFLGRDLLLLDLKKILVVTLVCPAQGFKLLLEVIVLRSQ